MSQNFCAICGDEEIEKTLHIETIGNLSFCHDCLPDIYKKINITPPKYFYIVKPRQQVIFPEIRREIFESQKEFELWCAANSDYKDSFYYGIFKLYNWSVNNRQLWISNGDENHLFFWTSSYTNLIDMVKKGHREIWTMNSPNLLYYPHSDFIISQLTKIGTKISILKKRQDRFHGYLNAQVRKNESDFVAKYGYSPM